MFGASAMGAVLPGRHITDRHARLFMDLRTTHTQKLAAAKAGISVASARGPARARLGRRHRSDPALGARGSPGDLLQELDRRFPGAFGERVRRTLERRVRDWRALEGPEKEIIFPQTHAPGRLGLPDFTDAGDLGVVVAGEPLPHLLFTLRSPSPASSTSRWCARWRELHRARGRAAERACGPRRRSPRTSHRQPVGGFRNLSPDAAEDITRRYDGLCRHYGMIASRNNRGVAHENGAIESRHGHAKRRIEQAVLVRGDRRFPDLDSYRAFLAEAIADHNARRRKSKRPCSDCGRSWAS
jgi:hypothetical protein